MRAHNRKPATLRGAWKRYFGILKLSVSWSLGIIIQVPFQKDKQTKKTRMRTDARVDGYDQLIIYVYAGDALNACSIMHF